MKRRKNNLFRRALAVAMAAVLMLQPVLATGLPAEYKSPFSDVKEGNWYYPFVASLNYQGVVSGYDDGRFGPDDPTRAGDAMIMILLAARVGAQLPEAGGHYASGYSNYAVKRGWLEEDQVPSLTGPITRLQAAQLAAKALGLEPSEKESPFADVDDGYVTALFEAGVVSGSVEGEQMVFKPQSSLTRAEMSVIVWQIRNRTNTIRFRDQEFKVLDSVPASFVWKEALELEDGRMSYSADGVESLLGVDVSAYQGRIDWDAVAEDGVDFAMIRAGGRYYGSGELYQDTRLAYNLEEAQEAGLMVGVYFFSQAVTVEEAQEEAEFLLELLDGAELTGPVVFDWENITYDTARTDDVDVATLTAMARKFCETVEWAGYQPMIYLNQYMAYLRYDLEGVAQYPFWFAHYSEKPDFPYRYWMWQYSTTGTVDGIEGNVDMNILFLPSEVG